MKQPVILKPCQILLYWRLHSCPCMEHWSKFWNAHLTETKWKNHNTGHYSTSSHRMVSVWSSASLLLVALVALGRIIRLKGSMAQSVRHPIPSPRPTVFELTRPVRREDSSFKSSMYSKRGEKAFLLVAGCYSLLAGHLPMCSCFCINKASELNTTFNSQVDQVVAAARF